MFWDRTLESTIRDTMKATNSLEMIEVWIRQLKAYRSPKKTKAESEYLEADIRGYQAVVDTKNEDLASRFLSIKHEAITKRRRFKNNEEVVKHMKKEGLWI